MMHIQCGTHLASYNIDFLIPAWVLAGVVVSVVIVISRKQPVFYAVSASFVVGGICAGLASVAGHGDLNKFLAIPNSIIGALASGLIGGVVAWVCRKRGVPDEKTP